MDLNITCQDASISSTRGSSQLNVYLTDIHENDLLSTENFQQIGIDKFVGEFGAENVLAHLKELYPELF
jgi:hypothetical protein